MVDERDDREDERFPSERTERHPNRTRLWEMVADLEETLEGLREKQGVSKREYETNSDMQDIVERRLEKATQTCIDIAGLRNVLAHRYRHIDSREIYESYHDLERLELFSESVYLYLQENSDPSEGQS